MPTATTESVKQMNSFLRGEIAAVETYDKALKRMDTVPFEIQSARDSHAQRVNKINAHIKSVGGDPDRSSGAWGAFANSLQSIATLTGDKATIALLEEGEDHGLKDYRRDYGDLDACCREFVQSELLPAQQRTHDSMSALKRSMKD